MKVFYTKTMNFSLNVLSGFSFFSFLFLMPIINVSSRKPVSSNSNNNSSSSRSSSLESIYSTLIKIEDNFIIYTFSL